MPRRIRRDYPGAWHHVMNRGIARRTVFEDRAGVRYWLANQARAVRLGDLEVHAFVIMTTHFHLLVRSPQGNLSATMQRLQNLFVRWFNRRARRDGPLFRGRFLSRPVESLRYRRLLVRYIDQNPVAAGMVEVPEQYPFGSARHYARNNGPAWLDRSWVEQDARVRTGHETYSRDAYAKAFGDPIGPSINDFVKARIEHPSAEPDPLKDLVGAAPDKVVRWMRRKARLADGTRPGLPCVPVEAALSACEKGAAERPAWRLPRGTVSVDPWPGLRVALMRDLAGLSWEQIARRLSISDSAARRRYAGHRHWIETESEYRETLAAVSAWSLR